MPLAPTKKRSAGAADRLINRELSFLDYDARVLALARDPDLPLLERVKFCSIFSQMLDEFFMVRIAGLRGQAAAGVTVRSPDGRTPQQTLREARERVLELQAEQARVWADELLPALAEEGIVVLRVEDLAAAEQAELGQRSVRGSPSRTFPASPSASPFSCAIPRRVKSGSPASRFPRVSRGSSRSARAGGSFRSNGC